MKIFFVLSGYRPYIGGAEQQTRCLADELCSMGHIVELLVVDDGRRSGIALGPVLWPRSSRCSPSCGLR